jgi:hypothetical protein
MEKKEEEKKRRVVCSPPNRCEGAPPLYPSFSPANWILAINWINWNARSPSNAKRAHRTHEGSWPRGDCGDQPLLLLLRGEKKK